MSADARQHTIAQLAEQVLEVAHGERSAKVFLRPFPLLFAKVKVDQYQQASNKTDQDAHQKNGVRRSHCVCIGAGHKVDLGMTGKSVKCAVDGHVTGRQCADLGGKAGALGGSLMPAGNRLAFGGVDPVKTTFPETTPCQTFVNPPRRPRQNPTARLSLSWAGLSLRLACWPMCSPVGLCLMARLAPAARPRRSALKTTPRPRPLRPNPHLQNRLPLLQNLRLRQQPRPRHPDLSLIPLSLHKGGHLAVSAFGMSGRSEFPFCSAKDFAC